MSEREKISEELRWRVLRRDNCTCRYCGIKTGPFHMDHVYPVSKGGETSYQNLVTACPYCNGWKHDKVGIWPNPIKEQTIPWWQSRNISPHVFVVMASAANISAIVFGEIGYTNLANLMYSLTFLVAFVVVALTVRASLVHKWAR